MSFFDKIKNGLNKTRNTIVNSYNSVISSFRKVDDELIDELEEILISADIGAATSADICEKLRQRIKDNRVTEPSEVKELLKHILYEMTQGDNTLHLDTKPSVIMVIGVNGVGKTTTIGKLASNLKNQGKSVMLAAADTFRAAAIEQLSLWADRAGVTLVKNVMGTDPASVIFDAATSAKAKKADVLICDTAGRLHNKKNLMDELAKMHRVISRELPDASVEVLLVLDASTGQNAVNQAREFGNVTDITGIVLTKLDGTAKGGVVITINNELSIPVKYIGVGEQIDDLQPFDNKMFIDAIFEEEN